jgi:CheY-like chemotaxis protein
MNGRATADRREDTHHVFIVDDEADMVRLYERYLEGSFRVSTETHAPRAVQRIDESVDVVLLDRRMPELSGAELLGILREEGFQGQIAIVTSISQDPEIEGEPFDEYVTKPVGEQELQTIVSQLVERQHFQQLSDEYFDLKTRKKLGELTTNSRGGDVEPRLSELRSQLTDLIQE